MNTYRAADGRWFFFTGLEADRHIDKVYRALGREDLHDDPRFADAAALRKNRTEVIAVLDDIIAEHPLDVWAERFDREGVWWAPAQGPADVLEDPQLAATDGGVWLEAEAIERVGTQVGQEHVGGGEQHLEVFPGSGVAQVEHDAALAAVVLPEGGVGEVLADPERTERTAHGVALGRLHFDDVRAPVGEQRAGGGGGDPHAQLDDAQAGEGGEAVRHRRAACSRNMSFITFPVALTGSVSTTWTTRGTL